MDESDSAIPARRVLVVDDEPDIRDLIEEVLSADRWMVDKAESAHQAMKLYRLNRYDLVTLDCAMPDVDGRDFHQTLSQVFGHGQRTSPLLPQRLPPIIVITAWYDQSEIEEMIFGEGIVGIMRKPVEVAKLQEIAHEAWQWEQKRQKRRTVALSRLSDRLVQAK